MSHRPKIKKNTKFNPFAPRTCIKFKGRVGFGLNANTSHLLDCLKQMNSVNYGETVQLDFRNVDFFYPSGINILAIAGRYLMKSRNCHINHVEPDSLDVDDFLTYSGFRSIVQGPGKDHGLEKPLSTFKMQKFPWADDNAIGKLIDVIESELNISIGTRGRIHENIAELINNVLDHSNSAFECTIIGQAYPKSKRIRYCIGDAGIGIKEHLSKKFPSLQNMNTSKVIEHATEYGVTGSFDNKNSGIGLNDLKKLVHICGGSFFILSGDGAFEEEVMVNLIEKTETVKKQYHDLDFKFNGTFVDVTLQANPNIKIFTKDENIPKEFTLIE